MAKYTGQHPCGMPTYAEVTNYSSGYKPKPTGQTKSQRIIKNMFSEVYNNPPRTLKTSNPPAQQRAQMVAIALSKARAAGARGIPKK